MFRRKLYIGVAVSVGIVCAIIGIAVGLRIALHATGIQCPDGTYIPPGETEVHCYAHRHAGDGTAIVLISVMLAMLIGLCGVIADAALAKRPRAD